MGLQVTCDRPPDITIVIDGQVISKKNGYKPTKKGMVKTQKIRNFEQMVMLQIPPEYRDLKLDHPDVVFRYKMPVKSWGSDSDNAWTSLLDVFVNMGVFSNDSTYRFNGTKVLMPVELSDKYQSVIEIWKKD